MKSTNKKLAIVLSYAVNIRDLINSGFLEYLLNSNHNYDLTLYTQNIDIKNKLNFKCKVLSLQEYKNSFTEQTHNRKVYIILEFKMLILLIFSLYCN